MSPRATTILGDLHLTRDSPAALTGDLVQLVQQQRGQRLVVAGDFFDIVSDDPHREQQAAARAILHAHPTVRTALAEHIDRDGELVLLGGNHDADVGQTSMQALLAESLELTPTAQQRLHCAPWFWRHGGLHVEHGHYYDPDNTPAHPLVIGERSLGVHFSAEFIHPTQAHRFLQANDETPLKLFLSSFQWYGKRAPYVIYRYFYTAFSALARSGPFYRAAHESPLGREREARYAEDAGVPAAIVEALMAHGARPTLRSWSDTFARMYLDRASTAIIGSAGLALAAFGDNRRQRQLGLAGGGLAAMLMTLNWLNGHNRYAGGVVRRLSDAAERIRQISDARYVVFGHTHREALSEGYANTGSFAFPRSAPGRPYLQLPGGSSSPERRYLQSRA